MPLIFTRGTLNCRFSKEMIIILINHCLMLSVKLSQLVCSLFELLNKIWINSCVYFYIGKKRKRRKQPSVRISSGCQIYRDNASDNITTRLQTTEDEQQTWRRRQDDFNALKLYLLRYNVLSFISRNIHISLYNADRATLHLWDKLYTSYKTNNCFTQILL